MRRTKVMVSVAVLLGLGVEYWSAPVAMRSVPLTPPRVYQWLERQTPLVTLELPVPSPAELWGAEPEFQFASVYHWRPLLNGYSGFAPRSYLERLQRWQPHGETALLPEPIRVWLATGGVQVVIVHERLVSSSQFNDALAACEDRRYFSEVVVFQAGAGAGRSAACRVRAADAARQ